MSEFIARLKQRKRVQWALAYVALAFALLQGVRIVAQRFVWPGAIEDLPFENLCEENGNACFGEACRH